MPQKPFTFDRVVRLVIGTLIVAAIILLTRRLSAVLLPFVIGWLLAYLVNPLVDFIQKKLHVTFRVPSIIIAFLFIVAVAIGIIEIVVPAVKAEASDIGFLASQFVSRVGADRLLSSETYDLIVNFIAQIDWEEWVSKNENQEVIKQLLPHFWNVVSSTMQIIIGIFATAIVLLYMIFILKDFENISDGFINIIPEKYRRFVSRLMNDVSQCTNHYFRGQALVALIVGVLFAIGFKIIGLPMGITIGLIIGVLNLVPYMQTLGLIPVMLLVMLQSTSPETNHWLTILNASDPWQCFWIMTALAAVVFLIVQTTQDLILVPSIMGKAMGLNPAVILLSLSVWGSLLGVIGMIVALPVTTLLISYYKRYVLHDFSANLFGNKTTEAATPPVSNGKNKNAAPDEKTDTADTDTNEPASTVANEQTTTPQPTDNNEQS